MADTAQNDLSPVWLELMKQVREHLDVCHASPARSVVLLPFAQLAPLAKRAWASVSPQGFMPRFETTRTWAQRLASFAPGSSDVSLNAAQDVLTARSMLAGAGLDLPAQMLMEAAWQLAPVAAAMAAEQRDTWREWVVQEDFAGGGWLAHETAIARLAIDWAAASSYATDVLFHESTQKETDALFIVQGGQTDLLADSLLDFFGPDKAMAAALPLPAQMGQIRLHAAPDAESEAQCAAACVLRHLAAGRAPVALASNDRALMRRVRALLGERLYVRDETGWRLSTTQSAAVLMAALQAGDARASSDEVLAWLKLAPAWAAADVAKLESYLRRYGVRHWPQQLGDGAPEDLQSLVSRINAARAGLQNSQRLPDWLRALRGLLQAAGQWQWLVQDDAGRHVLEALGLDSRSGQGSGDRASPFLLPFDTLPAARLRMSRGTFVSWVTDVLEAASFAPTRESPHLVMLPMAQLLARPFPALVLPGCDETSLPVAPEPGGLWTRAQRALLRLPTREMQQAAQQTAWAHALTSAHIDILWRQSDERGQPLLVSPLVLQLAMDLGEPDAVAEDDPRSLRELRPAPVLPPEPVANELPVRSLTASAYSNLRACPYRFFALHQLGLYEASELDAEVDKSDFGNWLHATLHDFHERLRQTPDADLSTRQAWLEQAAQEQAQALALPDGEFLPFMALWPDIASHYLQWLDEHEAQGYRYQSGEAKKNRDLPDAGVTLEGRIDRIDAVGASSAPRFLLDYKTERLEKTKSRIKPEAEDIQLPFYAALMGANDEGGEAAAARDPNADERALQPLQAAYLNLGERTSVEAVQQPDLLPLRDALLRGITQDMQAIAQGHLLRPLGQGSACTWCSARGLCRRDFWSQAPKSA